MVKKIILVVGLILIGSLGFYLYKLHALSIEGNNNFGLRCTTVNPPLIAYKSSFLRYADALNNPSKFSDNEIKSFADGYILGMRKYVKEETKWLEEDNKFINRWDFNLFAPWYMKIGAELQWRMYEGYKDDAQYILDIGDGKIVDNTPLGNISKARERRDKYSKLYYDFFDEASKEGDWRMRFTYIPLPIACNKENTFIPNTEGSIDWEEEATSSSKFVPIDPYNLI